MVFSKRKYYPEPWSESLLLSIMVGCFGMVIGLFTCMLTISSSHPLVVPIIFLLLPIGFFVSLIFLRCKHLPKVFKEHLRYSRDFKAYEKETAIADLKYERTKSIDFAETLRK